MAIRLGENLIDIDGVKAFEANGKWTQLSGDELSTLQLNQLFIFLNNEEIAKRKIFYAYVDDVINKLIYNK